MRARRGPIGEHARELCSGPGKLTQALGIWLTENGGSLVDGPVRIGERAPEWRAPNVVVSTRVGISAAVELPWRFCVAGNGNVSRPRPLGEERERRARRAGAALETA
jgi:DNA-3-methyladenine glycosylase